MSAVQDIILLQYTDLDGNNNKFYRIEILSDKLRTIWGRVGKTGQSKDVPGGRYEAEEIARSKERKEIQHIDVRDLVYAEMPNRPHWQGGQEDYGSRMAGTWTMPGPQTQAPAPVQTAAPRGPAADGGQAYRRSAA
jgi:predicted DNA-binding WGR domain protein